MTHYDDIHYQNRNSLIQRNSDTLRDTALLEFGVYHGTSILMWHDLYISNRLPIHFIGFDSFAGLPPESNDKNTIWKEGQFSTDGIVNPKLNKEGIKIVTGFYDQSLNQNTVELLKGRKVGLVHMDCDTYSSTKTVWEWLIQHDVLTNGALIVYDDWGAWLESKCGEYEVGEAKAHKEIERTHNVRFTDLGKYIVDSAFYEVKIYQYE